MTTTERAKLPRSLWIVFAGLFINRFGSFVYVFLVVYMISRGYTFTQAGVAASIYGIGSIGASALGGYFADRLGRRNTIVFSMFTSALNECSVFLETSECRNTIVFSMFTSAATMLILSQITTLWLFILLVGLAGMTSELYRPACQRSDCGPCPAYTTSKGLCPLALLHQPGGCGGSCCCGIARQPFFPAALHWGCVDIGLLRTAGSIRTSHRQVQPWKARPHSKRPLSGITERSPLLAFLLFLLASLMITFVYFQSQSTSLCKYAPLASPASA